MARVKMKVCDVNRGGCGEKKPITAFGAHWRAPDGHMGICVRCASKHRVEGVARAKRQTEEIREEKRLAACASPARQTHPVEPESSIMCKDLMERMVDEVRARVRKEERMIAINGLIAMLTRMMADT